MKVWALLSEENEYYQPRNNLQVLYEHKPSFEQLVKFLYGDVKIEELEEEQLISTVNLLQLKEVNVYDVYYRLEELTLGERLKQADD